MTYDRDLNDNRDLDRGDTNDLGMQGDKNTAAGGMEKVKGKLQKGLGKLTGDRSMQAEGTGRETKGDIQQRIGNAERNADDLIDQ
ncbi:MAG TPA: CsbD family protein [Ktedonobacterales bacterium]|nr:CsbD family protein [Ktedonobacterales bacterium]